MIPLFSFPKQTINVVDVVFPAISNARPCIIQAIQRLTVVVRTSIHRTGIPSRHHSLLESAPDVYLFVDLPGVVPASYRYSLDLRLPKPPGCLGCLIYLFHLFAPADLSAFLPNALNGVLAIDAGPTSSHHQRAYVVFPSGFIL
jgi:hypothetical protein